MRRGKTYEEIQQTISKQGYSGSVAIIRMFMQKERAHMKASKGKNIKTIKEYVYRKTLTQLVYKNIEDVTLITQNKYENMIETYPKLVALCNLVKEFIYILFSKNIDELDNWMKIAQKIKNFPELQSYIEGLKQDMKAVKNAIKYDYNNGLT